MNENLNSLWASLSNKFNIGSFEQFSNKMQTPEERKRFFDAMSGRGVNLGDFREYENRLGKAQDSTVDPTMGQDDMGSQLVDGSLESQEQDSSWFDQTWFGRGWAAASTTFLT